MTTEHIIPNEPPWIVEIDGISYATPEAVVLLLKAVSEERDTLERATEKLSTEWAIQSAEMIEGYVKGHPAYTIDSPVADEMFRRASALRTYADILEAKEK